MPKQARSSPASESFTSKVADERACTLEAALAVLGGGDANKDQNTLNLVNQHHPHSGQIFVSDVLTLSTELNTPD